MLPLNCSPARRLHSTSERLLGFIHSTESAHRLNIDAKEHSLNRHIAGLFAPFRQRDSPPSRILRESFLRMFLLSSIFRPTQLQERSSHYYAKPVRPIYYFVGLQTDLGILPHPLNLLAES